MSENLPNTGQRSSAAQSNDDPSTSYDSRATLECCSFAHLGRKIGVHAGTPFHHHGMDATYVDIIRETISVNTETYGNSHPVGTLTEAVAQATQATIDDLDGVIRELTIHKGRLCRELIELGLHGVQLQSTSATHPAQDHTATDNAVAPHADPTGYERDEDGRSIVARWNIGAPSQDGGQRQARFEVTFWKRHGYRAILTTVLERLVGNVREEAFPSSLMKFDQVHALPATRYSQAGLTGAYEAALEALRAQCDAGEPAIVRHFDRNAPIPQD